MAFLKLLQLPLSLVDRLLLLLVLAHDKFIYSPLHTSLTPLMASVPRWISVGQKKVTILTANRVTYTRTSLLIVIAGCLKFGYNGIACGCVILNDFLDHVDGIVAKAQRQVYGNIDNPLLGAFVDAFCDKVVNVSLLWSMLLLADLTVMSPLQLVVFVGVASSVISLECVLGVVRVQDYYKAKYSSYTGSAPSAGIRANLEGKLKEKLENIGLSLLCLAMASSNPMSGWFGWIGVSSLALSLRFAVGSLMYKLRARQAAECQAHSNGNVFEAKSSEIEAYNCHTQNGGIVRQQSAPLLRASTSSDSDEESERGQTDDGTTVSRRGEKVDKIYTVGCFDLFHRGHRKLLRNMRNLGKEVIVGIHNDESYYKLKKKHPIDVVEKRMANVKCFVDQVFVISSTDPSPYLTCCIHLKPSQTALYVRGDDMPQFPGRHIIEPLMPIQLLPYTQGISSTMLRAELLSKGEKERTTETVDNKLKSQ